MATSSGRYPTRNRNEAGQNGTISRQRLLQQQTQTTARQSQANGLAETRGGGGRDQEEITKVILYCPFCT